MLVAHSVPLQKNTAEIPEAQLLDVGVSVFDSGVPEGEVDKDVLEHLIKEGTFVQIRRSEALYMSVLLRNTLQKSDNWGTVWVTPKDSSAADLSVDGKILHSDGDYFQLYVKAVDATGHIWIDKKYEMSTAAGAFNRQRYPDLDPYQDVFNEIANDLAGGVIIGYWARAKGWAEETRRRTGHDEFLEWCELPEQRTEPVAQLHDAALEKTPDRVARLRQHAAVGGKARAFHRKNETVRHLAGPFAKTLRLLRAVEGRVDLD